MESALVYAVNQLTWPRYLTWLKGDFTIAHIEAIKGQRFDMECVSDLVVFNFCNIKVKMQVLFISEEKYSSKKLELD